MDELNTNKKAKRALDASTGDGGFYQVATEAGGEKFAARAQAYLFDAVESINTGLALFDAEDRLVLCNSHYRNVHPVVAELAVPGTPFEDMVRGIARAGLYGDPAGDIEAIIEKRLAHHRDAPSHHEHRLTDGRWVEIHETRTHDGGTVLLWTDITERKRAETLQRGRNRVLERLATGGSLEEVLSLLIATTEEVNPEMVGSVLLLDEDGRHLLHGAAPSLPDFYNQAIDGMKIGDGEGSCGTAAETGETVIVEDVMTHPYWADFRDLAAKADLRACWSQPIKTAAGEVLGTFAMYYREPRAPTPSDMEVIETSAQLAGVAIERKRMEDALSKSEERLRGAIGSLREGFVLYDSEDRLVAFNDRYEQIRPAASEILEQGGTFEESIRINVGSGAIVEARGREEAFIKKRLEQHRDPKGPIFRRFEDGRWYMIEEVKTPEGGTAISFIDITELKETEEALRESETRFRDFSESASDWFWEMDKDLRFNYFSDRFTEISGVANEDLIGKTRRESGLDLEDDTVLRNIADIGAHRPFKNFEHCRTRPNGDVVYMSTSGTPIFDANGDFKGYRGTGTDITKRKLAEAALKESEERFRAVIDYFPGAIVIKDLEGRYQTTNLRFCEWFDAESDRLIGKTVHDLLPKKSAVGIAAQEKKVRETGAVVENERRVTHLDGVTRDVFTQKFPIFGSAGDCVAVGTVINDITGRKQAEKALRKSEERLRGAIDSLQEGFGLFDAEDRLVALNDEYRRISPGAQEVMDQGGTFEDLLRAAIARGVIVEAAGREEEFVQERLKQHRDPKGPILRRFTDGSWYMLKEARTPEGGIALSFINITELKQAEEDRRLALVAAEEANQAKSEFLATISHELRTPLNAILGFAQILSLQYLGPLGERKYVEYADDICASGQYLLDLVNDILDISAIEAGTRMLDKEKISIDEAIAECAKTVAGQADENGIHLSTKVPDGMPPLYADRRAVKQILLNLLSNAVKFTPDGGKVTVTAKASKRTMTIKITDTGVGIPEERIANITDPFERGQSDPYVTQDGAGLGLAITRSLVALHDGQMEIKSTRGKGTTVTVSFPNAEP